MYLNKNKGFRPIIKHRSLTVGTKPYILFEFYCGSCNSKLMTKSLDYMYCPYCGKKIDYQEENKGGNYWIYMLIKEIYLIKIIDEIFNLNYRSPTKTEFIKLGGKYFI